MEELQKEFIKALEVAKAEAHNKLDYRKYESTSVADATNCATHAYGITTILDPRICRIGVISGKRAEDEEYLSRADLKRCFMADLEELGLVYEEVPIITKSGFLKDVNKMELAENQHIAVLFAKVYLDRKISDFHLLRYDNQKGWTEKYYHRKPNDIQDIDREWPSPLQWYERVAAFVITR